MKKILAVLLATSSVAVFADSFQDFNNNLYAQYQLTSINGGAGPNIDQWGIGGTFQSKNDVWVSAAMASGSKTLAFSNGWTQDQQLSNISLQAGYAFQFFGNDDSGFQVVPHVGFTVMDATGALEGTSYAYSLGVKPEYRLLSSLKVAVDLNLIGTQTGANAADGILTTNGQNFGYSVTPGIQYDISKTVMLGVDYTYANSFNSSSYGSNGNNIFQAKVGYLF